MNRQDKFCTATALLLSVSAYAGNADLTYSEANAIWEQSKNTPQYQRYVDEFAQFNNYYRLDERDGCYNFAGGDVELLLIVTHRDGGEYAVIEHVLANVESPKAQCFRKTYQNLRTKMPPFLPFVLQMKMG